MRWQRRIWEGSSRRLWQLHHWRRRWRILGHRFVVWRKKNFGWRIPSPATGFRRVNLIRLMLLTLESSCCPGRIMILEELIFKILFRRLYVCLIWCVFSANPSTTLIVISTCLVQSLKLLLLMCLLFGSFSILLCSMPLGSPQPSSYQYLEVRKLSFFILIHWPSQSHISFSWRYLIPLDQPLADIYHPYSRNMASSSFISVTQLMHYI